MLASVNFPMPRNSETSNQPIQKKTLSSDNKIINKLEKSLNPNKKNLTNEKNKNYLKNLSKNILTSMKNGKLNLNKISSLLEKLEAILENNSIESPQLETTIENLLKKIKNLKNCNPNNNTKNEITDLFKNLNNNELDKEEIDLSKEDISDILAILSLFLNQNKIPIYKANFTDNNNLTITNLNEIKTDSNNNDKKHFKFKELIPNNKIETNQPKTNVTIDKNKLENKLKLISEILELKKQIKTNKLKFVFSKESNNVEQEKNFLDIFNNLKEKDIPNLLHTNKKSATKKFKNLNINETIKLTSNNNLLSINTKKVSKPLLNKTINNKKEIKFDLSKIFLKDKVHDKKEKKIVESSNQKDFHKIFDNIGFTKVDHTNISNHNNTINIQRKEIINEKVLDFIQQIKELKPNEKLKIEFTDPNLGNVEVIKKSQDQVLIKVTVNEQNYKDSINFWDKVVQTSRQKGINVDLEIKYQFNQDRGHQRHEEIEEFYKLLNKEKETDDVFEWDYIKKLEVEF